MMMLYNYEYRANHTNATITVSVRTDEGKEVADFIAETEFKTAMNIAPDGWSIDEQSSEEY